MTLGRQCADVYAWLQTRGATGGTTDEIAEALDLFAYRSSISRRITDLAEAGLVHLAGHRPGRSGRRQQAWTTNPTTHPTQGELF